ncbi:unnamed protein product [Closterium sp. NIES-53]
MDVARTSMIHAAAPHFLWPFALQYAAHQLNLQPRVSLPETSPTLRWTGKVGDAYALRVWGSRAFVCNLSADKLSPRAVPCVFLGFPPYVPVGSFTTPPRAVFCPPRTSPSMNAVEHVEVAVDSGAARGAEPAGAGSGGAEPEGAEPGGAESRGAEPGGAESGGAEPGGAESGGAEPGGAEPGSAEPWGAGSTRVAYRGTLSRREFFSPQDLREWFARRWSRAARGGGTTVAAGSRGARLGGTGAAGAGGAAEATGVGLAGGTAGATGGTGAAGAGDAAEATGAGPAGGTAGATGSTGAAGPAGIGAIGAGAAGGVGAGGSAGAGPSEGAGVGAVGARGAASAGATAGGTGAVPAGFGVATRPRPYFVQILEQVLGLLPSTGSTSPFACPQHVPSQSQLQPASPLPAPSPYTGPTGGLAERREPTSRPASPVRATRTSRRAPRPCPPALPGTHQMALRPSIAPLRVPLPSPPESSLPVLADPVSDSFRAASTTVTRLLATVVTDPSFESTAASALVTELVDFAAHCRLDYATSLVAESASVCPLSVGCDCALSTDILEDRQEEFQCFAAALPHLVSTLTAPEGDPDAPDIPTPHSGSQPWTQRWLPGSPQALTQRQGVDYFETFSPTPKMTTLRVLLHVAAQRDYELHSLDFSTAFLQGKEIWLLRPTGFTGTTLAALGFAPSTADPSLFLRTDTSLPPFYILVYVLQRFDFTFSLPQATPLSTRHSLSALPSDESVESSGPYPELVGCLITSGLGLVLGGRSPVVVTGHADASWVDDLATQRSSQGYTFSLGSGSVSWRSTRSSSVLSSSCEAEIYVGAMAAQELRWLTYLLTDLGEPPRSPPVLTKHIALRYFLARELQQRGQLRLAYVASEANTADIFTKELPPRDHQRFCTMLGLVPTWPHLLTS